MRPRAAPGPPRFRGKVAGEDRRVVRRARLEFGGERLEIRAGFEECGEQLPGSGLIARVGGLGAGRFGGGGIVAAAGQVKQGGGKYGGGEGVFHSVVE